MGSWKILAKNWWSFRKMSAKDIAIDVMKAAGYGFFRGFVVGLLSTTKGSWRWGIIGGAISLFVGISIQEVKTVTQGLTVFADGWTAGVIAGNIDKLFESYPIKIRNWGPALQFGIDFAAGILGSRWLKW